MTMTPTSKALANLFHHRWAVPALAALHELGGGAKLVTLFNNVGATRDSMRRTLAGLLDLGLVMRNPGYGHPMRPEFLLTKKGKRVAKPCAALWQTVQALDAQPVAFKKWAMPALSTIGAAGERFGEIASGLGGVTPRALAQTLQELQKAGIIERRLKDGAPPYAEYRATPPGRRLMKRVAAIGLAVS